MRLEKAKEIAEVNIKEASPKMPPDVKDALIILSEAAQFILVRRKNHPGLQDSLLPSETQE